MPHLSRRRRPISLETALRFNEDDLELNKQGELSEAQAELILFKIQQRIEGNRPLLLGAGGAALVAVALCFVSYHSVFLMLALAFGAMAGVLLASNWYHTEQMNDFRRSARVQSVSGEVKGKRRTQSHDLQDYEDKTFDAYYVWVNPRRAGSGSIQVEAPEIELPVSRLAYNAFVDGEHYTVYFVDGGGLGEHVVSAVPQNEPAA